MPSNRRSLTVPVVAALALVIVAAAATLAGAEAGKTSRAGWPHINGKLKFATNAGGTLTGGEKSDELLGAAGDDVIEANGAADVIWGDKDYVQPVTQHDTLDGGDGSDFIYTSHGTNTVDAGAGNDTIHAHYGGGSIDCGPGNDKLYVSHKSESHFKISHCELVSLKPAARG